MNVPLFSESPFELQISFHKLIETLENIAQTDAVPYRVAYAQSLLNEVNKVPELREGIHSMDIITKNEPLIKSLMSDLFPTALTNNEIKAVSIPFQNIAFNFTERFKKILEEAGESFDMTIRDFDEHQFYIMNCCLILKQHYNQTLDLSKPLFYDIPDAKGIMHHYRIMYNGDFIELFPKKELPILSQDKIDSLMDNFDNLTLWKETFPPNSWIMKGFGIVILFDVSVENALSNLKSNLLRSEPDQIVRGENIENIFRSIFKVPDLKVGFTPYIQEENKFKMVSSKDKFTSFILLDSEEADCKNALCGCSFETLMEEKKYFSISHISKFSESPANKAMGQHLLSQGIESCIMAPVVKDNTILGIIELASSQPGALNSVNAHKLDIVLPFVTDTLDRYYSEFHNQIDAVIQKEYTSIHPSVSWKFKQEAQNFLVENSQGRDYTLKEIVFKNVYPLYGQIDIKGSSETRNKTTQTDLSSQLRVIRELMEEVKSKNQFLLFEQRIFEIETMLNELSIGINANTELQIQLYIQQEIHPLFENADFTHDGKKKVKAYFDAIDPKMGTFYQARKKFDTTLAIINKKMASLLDEKQVEAQAFYPHYYERFKTDGVEHNIYIGASIAPHKEYNTIYLQNLRLWQLQVMCEMEMAHHDIKTSLPFPLEVTSLILVSHSPIAIRFRMDEKRFDVDGTYNARYEVVKKRIDKAYIKGTRERITEQGKITIVYSGKQEETEYMKYIQFLQFKGVLDMEVEQFEIEDLQGIFGLKATRVKVLHVKSGNRHKYSYEDLLNELLN